MHLSQLLPVALLAVVPVQAGYKCEAQLSMQDGSTKPNRLEVISSPMTLEGDFTRTDPTAPKVQWQMSEPANLHPKGGKSTTDWKLDAPIIFYATFNQNGTFA